MNNETSTASGPAEGLPGSSPKGLKEIAGETGNLLKDVGCVALHELSATRSAMTEKARSLSDSTWQLAREKPWTMMGVAAATGLIIGSLISRR